MVEVDTRVVPAHRNSGPKIAVQMAATKQETNVTIASTLDLRKMEKNTGGGYGIGPREEYSRMNSA